MSYRKLATLTFITLVVLFSGVLATIFLSTSANAQIITHGHPVILLPIVNNPDPLFVIQEPPVPYVAPMVIIPAPLYYPRYWYVGTVRHFYPIRPFRPLYSHNPRR